MVVALANNLGSIVLLVPLWAPVLELGSLDEL
jgi:hypothetical protein